jgi:hypothetical protein
MGDVPEQVFIDAARAWVTTVDCLDGQRWADLPLVIPDNPALRAAVASAYRAGQAATPDGPRRLNGPMVARLRACAADTSPNWDGAVTVYPPEARDLVALIDDVLTDVTPAADGQDGDGRG